MNMPFGKYKDTPIEEIPQGYLEWVVGGSVTIEKYLKETVDNELKRREELKTRSSVSNVITDSEDISIQSLYSTIRRMPQSLFNRPLILNKEFRIKVEKL